MDERLKFIARLLDGEKMAAAGVGALGGIRTPDPQIRSLVLYPAELRAPRFYYRSKRLISTWAWRNHQAPDHYRLSSALAMRRRHTQDEAKPITSTLAPRARRARCWHLAHAVL